MNIYLNGEAREVPDNCSAAQLVEELCLGGKRIAMEVNQEIVPRSSYAEHSLRADDRVEIVHAIGGGSCMSH
jgi:thiamine biosynthesis protein ThiS